MVEEYLLFGLSIFSFVFVLLGLVFFLRLRFYEDKRLQSGISALLFGVFLLMLFLLSKSLYYSMFFLEGIFNGFGGYVSLINSLSGIVFLPLMSICFLVGMLLFKEI